MTSIATLPMVLPSCSVQESCCPRLISHRSPPQKGNPQQQHSANSVFEHPCAITIRVFTSKVSTYHTRSYYTVVTCWHKLINTWTRKFQPQETIATKGYKRSETMWNDHLIKGSHSIVMKTTGGVPSGACRSHLDIRGQIGCRDGNSLEARRCHNFPPGW